MGIFDNGHIKLFRKMLDWEWYDDTNTVRVFIHCLLRANWKDTTWRGFSIKRGSFITSRQSLSRQLNLSEQEIRTALEHLEATNEITRSVFPKFSVITVVKYDEYQSSNQQNNQQNTDKATNKSTKYQPGINQVATTDEEYKESNKGKNKRKKPPRGWIEFVYHDSEWLRDHSPEDGWKVEELDGVYYVHRVKV